MPERIVVDASVWVSHLRPQDVHHDASHAWLERYTAAGNLLIASSFLSLEVAAAISRGTGDSSIGSEAVKTLQDFPAMYFISLDAALMQNAIDVATNLQLRAGDAIYVALAHALSLPLISWDKEQLQKPVPSLRHTRQRAMFSQILMMLATTKLFSLIVSSSLFLEVLLCPILSFYNYVSLAANFDARSRI